LRAQHTGSIVIEERYKKAIREITEAENKAEATEAMKKFAQEFGTKWPKAVAIVDEKEMLLAYYDYPAEHWRHFRTTNLIESPFAVVRARTDLTKGPRSRKREWR
jgi:transposase-like protein